MTAKGNKYQPHRRPEWTLLLYNNNVLLDTRDRRSSLGILGRFKDVGRLVQMLLRSLFKGSVLTHRIHHRVLSSPSPSSFAHNPGPRSLGCEERNDGPLVFVCMHTSI